MVFMGGVASPWADTEPMVVEWIQPFEEHWRYKGGEVQCICTIKKIFSLVLQ